MCALFTSSISATSGDLIGKKICIDPGHGGSDPGAINNEFGLFESTINLDVSYGLKWLLENEGAEVVLTRTDDSYKDNNDRYTFCNSEAATILISIHTNSVVDPSGVPMALYFPDDDDRAEGGTVGNTRSFFAFRVGLVCIWRSFEKQYACSNAGTLIHVKSGRGSDFS